MRSTKSEIRNTKSEIRRGSDASRSCFELRASSFRRSRRGVSILEVIFAILVTTIGLLAALSVFPVAAALARKGRIADETAIAGPAAVHKFDTHGYRRPDMWMGWNPAASPPQFTGIPTNALGNPIQQNVSFCIDPRFIANAANSTPAFAPSAMTFPYVPVNTPSDPRMYRIGTRATLGGPLVSQAMANSIFTFADDLALSQPSDGNLPAFDPFEDVDHDNDDPTNSGAGTPRVVTVRSTGGHLSWMATLVPKHEHYAASAVLNDQYVLSIVVFHDRPLIDLQLDTPGPNELYLTSERVAGVNFADAGGLGYAGGETFLIWPPTGTIAASPANFEFAKQQLKVRAGDWIMLAGLAPRWVTPPSPPVVNYDVPVFRWYRVTEADHDPDYHGGSEQHYALAVSLAGSDWDTSLLNQQAFLITGVVGVYEKTVRLETGVGF